MKGPQGAPRLINPIRIIALRHVSQHPNSRESVFSTFWGAEDLNTETDLMTLKILVTGPSSRLRSIGSDNSRNTSPSSPFSDPGAPLPHSYSHSPGQTEGSGSSPSFRPRVQAPASSLRLLRLQTKPTSSNPRSPYSSHSSPPSDSRLHPAPTSSTSSKLLDLRIQQSS